MLQWCGYFTARKRSLRRLCFYTCLSVILFTRGGVPGQVHPLGKYTSISRYTPQEGTPPSQGTPLRQVHLPGQVLPWAGTSPGQVHPTPGQVHPHPWTGTIPPWAGTPTTEQCMLGDTGNKRAVRILLECILVIHHIDANGILLFIVKIRT